MNDMLKDIHVRAAILCAVFPVLSIFVGVNALVVFFFIWSAVMVVDLTRSWSQRRRGLIGPGEYIGWNWLWIFPLYSVGCVLLAFALAALFR